MRKNHSYYSPVCLVCLVRDVMLPSDLCVVSPSHTALRVQHYANHPLPTKCEKLITEGVIWGGVGKLCILIKFAFH